MQLLKKLLSTAGALCPRLSPQSKSFLPHPGAPEPSAGIGRRLTLRNS